VATERISQMGTITEHEIQKHLHRFLYASHYFPDLTASQLKDRRLHLEHCL